jgi:hypothetical protein
VKTKEKKIKKKGQEKKAPQVFAFSSSDENLSVKVATD